MILQEDTPLSPRPRKLERPVNSCALSPFAPPVASAGFWKRLGFWFSIFFVKAELFFQFCGKNNPIRKLNQELTQRSLIRSLIRSLLIRSLLRQLTNPELPNHKLINQKPITTAYHIQKLNHDSLPIHGLLIRSLTVRSAANSRTPLHRRTSLRRDR
jgi:hypothetical protein